jgi:hypothetical protein
MPARIFIDVYTEYATLLPANPPSLYPSGHAKIWRVFVFQYGRPPVKYSKPPLSFDDQADLAISRGLVADRAELVER